jgi:hypothetical protein
MHSEVGACNRNEKTYRQGNYIQARIKTATQDTVIMLQAEALQRWRNTGKKTININIFTPSV